MYDVSDDFLANLEYSHAVVTRVSAYTAQGSPIAGCDDIPVSGGEVSVDWSSQVRRTCSVEIADWRYASYLKPYGTQLFIQKGVRFMNGQVEWCPLGYFRIEDGDDSWPKKGFTLTGVDRAKVVSDNVFTYPDQPRTGNSIKFEINRLIADAFALDLTSRYYGGPAAPVVNDLSAGLASTVYQNSNVETPKVWMVGDNRWQGVLDIALAAGCEVYFDPQGKPTIRRVPVITDTPVWRVESGKILVSSNIKISRANTYNVVVVNTIQGTDTPIIVTAADTDPLSPTYVGAYGRLVYTYPRTVPYDLASTVTSTILSKTRTLIREVSFTTVCNPALEGGDVITQVYPDGTEENFLVDSFSIPLGVVASMDVNTRSTAPNLEEFV